MTCVEQGHTLIEILLVPPESPNISVGLWPAYLKLVMRFVACRLQTRCLNTFGVTEWELECILALGQ